jgi:DNA-damage-inducible protein D
MNLSELRQKKGVLEGRSVLDFMSGEELAANLFRITQTQAKIRNEKLRGQLPLERAAHDVGQTVRRTMIEISGKTPESLPTAEDTAGADEIAIRHFFDRGSLGGTAQPSLKLFRIELR